MSLDRAANAKRVHALKATGLNGVQIAERLGLSRSYTYELLSDPEGNVVRARKDSYRGTCERCGARTDGSNGINAPVVCHRCDGPEKSARMTATFGDQRDKLAALYRSGMSFKDIAAAMGWGQKNAEHTVTVAMHRLRRDYGYDLPYRYPQRRGKRVVA